MINIFWIGGNPPNFVQSNVNEWRKKYPSSVRFWVDQDCLELIKELKISNSWPEAMKVDLLRVAVISNYGGWYCDADTFPHLAKLVEHQSAFFVREEGRRFCNGIFFAPQNHPFMTYWESEVIKSINEMWPHENLLPFVSGPHALSRAIYTYALEHGSQKSKNDLSYARWNFAKFLHAKPEIGIHKSRTKNSTAIFHLAANTWRNSESEKNEKNIFQLFLYSLRQSCFSWILDLARHLIKNSRLFFPISLANFLIILNSDNLIIDQTEKARDFWIILESIYDLPIAVRNLRIGGIYTSDERIRSALLSAGWIKLGKNRFIRPKIVKLLSKNFL